MDKTELLELAEQAGGLSWSAESVTMSTDELARFAAFILARASDDAVDAALYRRFNPMWCDALNRRATVEQWMFEAANGKRPMPTADELREWALKLGTPSRDVTELSAAMSGKGGAE